MSRTFRILQTIYQFTTQDVDEEFKELEAGTVPGFDEQQPKLLINTEKRTRKWISKFPYVTLMNDKLPSYFKMTKIMAT